MCGVSVKVTSCFGMNGPSVSSDLASVRLSLTRPASIVGWSGSVAELSPSSVVVTVVAPVAMSGFESISVSVPTVWVVKVDPSGLVNTTT